MSIENYFITKYQNSPIEDQEIESLLNLVFVEEGYTEKSLAEQLFASSEVKKRGQIILARSAINELVGMIICVDPKNPAARVAKLDEIEVQLFAICPKARGQGIASALIEASERCANSLGFKKMVLSTQASMKAAHKVYERHGYKRNPTRDWQRYRTKFLVYEKSILNNQ